MPGAADPFELGPRTAERGVVLVHGFTGTPFEMRFLGERLAETGLAVVAPRLAGHQRPQDLARTRWPDWLGTVDRALDRALDRAGRVAIAGMSLGGLLALATARRRPADVAALAVFGVPLQLFPNITRAAEVLDRMLRATAWRPIFPKLGGSDVRDPAMRAANPAVPGFPLASLRSLMELAAVVRADLEQVRQPVFAAHALEDHVAPYACGLELLRRLPDVRFLPLPRSYHVVTIDVERELLAAEVSRFLAERL